MSYVVCTSCSFLRAYGSQAADDSVLEQCPQCGAALLHHSGAGRFPPAYVSRLGLDLFATPELEAPAKRPRVDGA